MADETDDQAMLQMMGFSSFGGQANKKRKYNSAADASMSVHNVKSQAASSSTGANSLPLGNSKAPTSINKNEINLDDESDDDIKDETGVQAPSDTAIGSNEAGINTLKPGAGLPSRPAGVGIPPDEGNHDSYQTQNANRKPWYEGYYDYDSNKNPWAQLEQRMGLQPLDEWPGIEAVAPTT
ncbi:hypothetical protein VHEMI00135 [[Torrubiella] hemipterigena]|uniref:Uncharacterized protein n=1 Tax=[Torrubiella] hemipterigena TaxID=1531966 RepID=A0A0A1SIE8_9HYPO|nr:hypothetical protein VHEMI00135 [[Torrubiella] hemipterigena]